VSWLNENLVQFDKLPDPPHVHDVDHETVLQREIAFGYTFEDCRKLVLPMARDGVEPVGSMGTDTPLAVLSSKSQLLYNYFKQLFAQVTNPPIDCIREEIITSAFTLVGSERNLLKPEPASAHMIQLKSPILDNEQLEKLRHIVESGFKAVTLPILFPADSGGKGLGNALANLFSNASRAIAGGTNIIVLSDRGVDETTRPFRRCSPSPDCTIISFARARARASASCSNRRAARGPPLRALHWLRLHGHQSISCVRGHRRFDSRRFSSKALITRRPARTTSSPS
jgi:hypothetical protein